MANEYPDLMRQGDLFVDESGWTSMEPEGGSLRPHVMEGWGSMADVYPYDRWEGWDADGNMERGLRPVEGDGDGRPE